MTSKSCVWVCKCIF